MVSVRRADVVDMQWCPDAYDPWLFATVSDDSTNPKLGGGSIQVTIQFVYGCKSFFFFSLLSSPCNHHFNPCVRSFMCGNVVDVGRRGVCWMCCLD